ncbi:MAG TPA: ATP-dependent Clp protease adapter ClpS [Mariprofundaceae bacterium]|nr:ATP-dependent Clp protease adapter ClpS [Mariprofundaceae bacterium]
MSEILTPDHVRKHAVETGEPQLQRPPMFRIIMLNDDYTPMEFVVDILIRLFHKSPDTAAQLMLQVHQKGSAVCGVYPRDIAETKLQQVENASREQGHPLKCIIEKDTDD